MIWQFSYHTPYQPGTLISAQGPKYDNFHIIPHINLRSPRAEEALGLIWVSRVDMGYDMKIAM